VGLAAEQRDLVETITTQLVAKLLHARTIELQEQARALNG
jgi:hypothetical protein